MPHKPLNPCWVSKLRLCLRKVVPQPACSHAVEVVFVSYVLCEFCGRDHNKPQRGSFIQMLRMAKETRLFTLQLSGDTKKWPTCYWAEELRLMLRITLRCERLYISPVSTITRGYVCNRYCDVYLALLTLWAGRIDSSTRPKNGVRNRKKNPY